MTLRGWSIVVAFGLFPLAGCVGPGWDEGLDGGWAGRWGALWTEAFDPATAGGTASVDDAGGDATPIVDILAASIAETPEALVVTIRVAAFPADLTTLAAAGWQDVAWEACWTSPQNFGLRLTDQCAGVAVGLGGTDPDVKGHFGIYVREGCNDWAWCDWQVPYHVEAGTPGSISVIVPRALLPHGEKGDNLTSPFIWAHGTTVEGLALDDASATMANFTFQTEHRPREAARSTLLVDDRAGDASMDHGNQSALDVVTVRQSKGATSISWHTEFVHLPAAASHQSYAAVGIGERVIEAWYTLDSGQVIRSGGGYCTKGCADYVEFPIEVLVEPGSPGKVTVTLPAAKLPAGIAKERVSLADFYVWSARPGQGTAIHPPADATAFAGDWAWGASTGTARP